MKYLGVVLASVLRLTACQKSSEKVSDETSNAVLHNKKNAEQKSEKNQENVNKQSETIEKTE